MNPIILEGPDGAGKSTVAKHLINLGYQRMNFSVPPPEARQDEEGIFRFFFAPLYHAISTRGLVVCDRLHLSDPIYGPLMRGSSPLTPRVAHLIERYVEAVDGQIVICLPPRRVTFANWLARRGAEYVQDARIFHKVYDGYARLLFNQKRNRNFLWFDYTRHCGERFARVLGELQGRPLSNGMVGSQRPRFLVVGEKANTPWDLPFMTTRGCSGWLHDALADAGYQEHELAFANALKADGTPGLTHDLVHCLRPTLILLGNTASEVLGCSAATTVHHLPHPQFCNRFKAKERAAYVAALAKIRRSSP